MALRRDMPTRDPKRAETDPKHSKGYASSRGGWTKPAETKTPKGK